MPNLLRPAALAAVALLSACGARQNPPATAEPPPSAHAATATPQSPKLRLPTEVRPTGYTVELTLDPKVATFQGVVDIDLDVTKPVSVVWLHAKGLTVRKATLTQGASSFDVTAVAGEEDFLGFPLAKALATGPAKLRIVYDGLASEKETNGAFRVNEGDDWYVYTQFEPVAARRVFPSFDEPGFKVPWQLTFHVPAGTVAVTNTPQESEEARPDGGRTFRFARTQPLPSYLIAFGVGPFDFLPAADAGQKKVKTRIITPRGRTDEGVYAAQVTPEILAALEDYFGIPYPYEKLDVLAVPLLGGAMEHPGLVTFNSRFMLSKPAEDSLGRQRAFSETQVHELAHQWFGNLVTMQWWDDLWLNEAFASWMTPRIVETWRPTWDAPVERVHDRARALDADSLLSARRIRQPIESANDIHNAFDGITYGKGSAVLSMTEEWLGRDVFRRGIQRYFRKHAGGNATAKDFLDAVSAESGKDVTGMLGTFLDQSGAPLVTASLACGAAGAKVVLTQKRYLRLGTQSPGPQTWKVPVCVKYAAGAKEARTCALLEGERTEVALPEAKACPAWVFPNAEGAGYFRVQLDTDAAAMLAKSGMQKLSRTERVTFLTDVRALALAGALPAADALSLARRMANDPDRVVTLASLDLLELVSSRLLPDDKLKDRARFLRETYGPRARQLGFTPRKGENEDTRLLRPRLVRLAGRDGRDPKLLAEARTLADTWLKDKRAVAPEMVDVVLAIAATEGDAAFQEKLAAAVRGEKDRRTRQYLIGALSNFTDPELVKKNLALVFEKGLDPRETVWMAFAASQGLRTQDVAFDFVTKNYDRLVGSSPEALLPEEAAGRMAYVGSNFCDAGKRQQMADFFTERSAKAKGGPRTLAQVLEIVDQCIALKQAQGASVESFLAQGATPRPPQAPAAR
ncbi:M1 family metallopeptidase [Comamonas sp. JC664]|uniref:M1 family metallopeptidase n=1 Tax=Comamonas sp. JC664 TaxID=2801917 RepID=UPI00174C0F48|nr:M1 family metallopeptidase [Comamonas sp. JC664]MBL0698686.1 M1 family metallopeptidase [Comamonas sp. JC664]GHG78500.1 aminopeptidase [Comamonas sp. KCTC 72670]